MHCVLLYAHFSNETGKSELDVHSEVAAACSQDPDLVALGLKEAHPYKLDFHLSDSNRQFLLGDFYVNKKTGENWAIDGGGALIESCCGHFIWRNAKRPKKAVTFKGKYGITIQQMERFVRVCEGVGLLLLATQYFRLDTMRKCKGYKLHVNYSAARRRGIV